MISIYVFTFVCQLCLQVILIYPGENSVTLSELAKLQPSSQLKDGSIHCEANQSQADTQNHSNKADTAKVADGPATNNVIQSQSETYVVNSEPPLKRQRHDSNTTRCPFVKVVFIDSTWSQAKRIYLDERLKGSLWSHCIHYLCIVLLHTIDFD